MKNHNQKRLLSLPQASEYMGMSISTLRKLIFSGKITYCQYCRNGKIWIDRLHKRVERMKRETLRYKQTSGPQKARDILGRLYPAGTSRKASTSPFGPYGMLPQRLLCHPRFNSLPEKELWVMLILLSYRNATTNRSAPGDRIIKEIYEKRYGEISHDTIRRIRQKLERKDMIALVSNAYPGHAQEYLITILAEVMD